MLTMCSFHSAALCAGPMPPRPPQPQPNPQAVMGYPQPAPQAVPQGPLPVARREATNDYAALFVALIGEPLGPMLVLYLLGMAIAPYQQSLLFYSQLCRHMVCRYSKNGLSGLTGSRIKHGVIGFLLLDNKRNLAGAVDFTPSLLLGLTVRRIMEQKHTVL